ncbi:MAG: alpha/beta fold hydrolase [Hyphomicrobium sp.]
MAGARPELVLLPGLDGTGQLFDRLEQRLKAALQITIVRYPADAAMTYAGYAAYVRDVIGERPVAVLGESFSGPVAISVAAGAPKQIRGVILSATFVRSPWPSWLIRRAARYHPKTAPAFVRNVVLMGRYQDPDLITTIEAIVANLPPSVRAARLQAVAAVDVRQELARIACPILTLHGDGDWLVPKRSLEVALRFNRNAEMAVIPGAHMLLQTRVNDAARRIMAFMASIGQTTP